MTLCVRFQGFIAISSVNEREHNMYAVKGTKHGIRRKARLFLFFLNCGPAKMRNMLPLLTDWAD